MRPLTRLVLLALLAWAMATMFRMAHASQAGDTPDGTSLVMYYGGIVGIGTLMAAVLAMWLLPAIGDFFGGFLFNPAEPLERHPHAAALAKVAVGDYPAAIEEFRLVFAENPTDMLAVREIIHIYCDKLDDLDGAALFVGEAIRDGNWNDHQRGLLVERLRELGEAGANVAFQAEPDEYPDI